MTNRGRRDGAAWEPPGPGHRERMALPRHLGAAAVALFDHLPDRLAAEVGDAAAAAVEAGRGRLAGLVEAGTELTVDAYQVRRAAACPASAAGEGEAFRWTPASAARHLGLRSVTLSNAGPITATGRRRPLEEAVREVMAELVASGGERSPGPWLASLGPPGRAAAQAQAQRWAEQVDGWLPLRLVDRRDLRFLDDDWWPGGARGGRTLVIHGRRDLTVDVGGRRVAVTMAGGTASQAGADDTDALTALAATLCDPKGRLVRVVRVHAASGEVAALDVTAELLDRGVAVVLSTAAAVAGAGASAIPGPACTWCHRQSVCPPGRAWVGRPDRRSMGLPLGPSRHPGPAVEPA